MLSMQIVVVGPGALGSLVAGRLAEGGAPVLLSGRPSPHLDRIRAAGAQAYVSKPISVARFVQEVSALLPKEAPVA